MVESNFIQNTKIYNRLPGIMGEKKVSIRELSRDTGVTYTVIWDLYHGRRQSVKFEVLEAICNRLGVGIGDLLQHIPDKEK